MSISTGEGIVQVADQLKAKGLIRSTLAFRMHARFHNTAANLKSGRYVLSGKHSTPELAKTVTEADQRTSQFTIKEGVTQAAIAKQLGKLEITDEGQFSGLKAKDYTKYDFLRAAPDGATLEGFLFPETYGVPPEGTSAKDVATIMLNEFDKKLTPELRSQIQANGRTLYETIIIASIVEQETKFDADRPLVASVLYRRLQDGIRLDADPTTAYGLNKSAAALTKADLDSDNPYNTRKIKGLPPGPICNPGLAAIKAAITAKPGDYLFYIADKQGHVVLAKTLQEHEANVQKYLQ